MDSRERLSTDIQNLKQSTSPSRKAVLTTGLLKDQLLRNGMTRRANPCSCVPALGSNE
ncbi:hypothetical protein CRENBAI_003611 [Crenichthys baileyi]|uniref:Uncharacterized protein n=1 Tax=Crenichthys baileyi TaxID=28760 RepID=A0AAV9S8K2_9TELE